MGRRSKRSPIERVTGRTRDSNASDLKSPARWPTLRSGSTLTKVSENRVPRDFRRKSPRTSNELESRCRSTFDRVRPRFPLPRKEVIQPQVPLRLPCYDFTPVTSQTLGDSFPKVRSSTSGSTSFRGVTGGVYKARERIHRGMLIRDY